MKFSSLLCFICLFTSLKLQSSQEFLPPSVVTKRANPFSSFYNLTISDEKKFVWFRVAKVGTRSIYAILNENHINLSVDQYNIKLQPKYADYFKFAFVRNPWDRIVSCYFNKVVSQAYPAFKDCFGKDFDYFVDFINRTNLENADAHIKLQTALIPVNYMDFIGKIENFEEDLKYVGQSLGISINTIPQMNRSIHEHYSKYYTERTKKIIERKYKKDIKAFGYKFENTLN